jgi:Protein of unknown function (DUF1579)
MKLNYILLSLFAVLQLTSFAQSKDNMKAMIAYSTPSAAHLQMKAGIGEWKEQITMWASPEAEPTFSLLTCNVSMIMNDRYQVSTHTGEVLGNSFEGVSTLAYDNALNKYISTWVDNTGTGMTILEGTADSTGTVITLKGTQVDPITKTKVNVREVYRIINESYHEMEMYTIYNGKEFKNMEIKFNR